MGREQLAVGVAVALTVAALALSVHALVAGQRRAAESRARNPDSDGCHLCRRLDRIEKFMSGRTGVFSP